MIIYLIRHALSNANLKNLVTGNTEDNLSNKGVSQAVDLKNWIYTKKIKPEKLYVSHWKRAKQTAQILFPDLIWNEDIRLGETNAGLVSEYTLKNFISTWPDFYSSNSNSYPGGESHMDLNNRVLSFWNEIKMIKVKSIMIVTHSGPISCILQNILGINMDHFPSLVPAQATLSIVKKKIP